MNHRDYLLELESNKKYKRANEKLRLRFQLGNALIRFRVDNNLSQAQLAKLLLTSKANVSRLEDGL